MRKTQITESDLQKRLVKSLLTGFVFVAAVIAGFVAIRASQKVEGLPVILKKSLDLNSKLSASIYSNENLSVLKPAPTKPPRVNGMIGLKSPVDLENYRVNVESGDQKLSLKLDEIKKIPFSETSTDFRCVEGWSEVFQYAGVRFADFMQHFKVGLRSDGSPFNFVGLETPDGEYYVSLDTESMMHSQTILVFEMYGQELRLANGFPIRLIVPNKYGIKSLKRIGKIVFSDTRPPDYWNQRGYDWFSGL